MSFCFGDVEKVAYYVQLTEYTASGKKMRSMDLVERNKIWQHVSPSNLARIYHGSETKIYRTGFWHTAYICIER